MTKKPTKPAKPESSWPGARLRLLSELIPYEHNARTHPPAQVKFLADLLTKFGPDQPIVVDENDVILKGHGRQLAAEMAGQTYFPVVQRTGMSEDDKRAMRIADNQSALMSGWDAGLVKFEIETLKRNGYDVALLGFGDQQLVQFTTTPAPPQNFQTFDETIPTAFCCPRCSYRWSGNPLAGDDKDEVNAAKVDAKPKPRSRKNGGGAK